MRGKPAKNRPVAPDAIYGSQVVGRFINKVMLDGKKSTAIKNVYGAISYLAKETKEKPMEAFEKALENIKPKMEIRSRRVGGANYQVPVPVREERQEALAMRWIIAAARDARKKNEFAVQLGMELVSAHKKEGTAFKKKEDTHKMAEANKAFAQFAF